MASRTIRAAARSVRSFHSGNRISQFSLGGNLLRQSRLYLTPPVIPTAQSYSSTSSSALRNGFRHLPFTAIALIVGGITLTAAGLWQFYTSGVNAFPEGIRDDLRKALYYQNYGDDRDKAVGYYRSALNAAMQHPDLRVDGPEVTGIMIQLGTMFQDMDRTQEAIDVLVMAFECLVHGRTMGMTNDSVRGNDGQEPSSKSSNLNEGGGGGGGRLAELDLDLDLETAVGQFDHRKQGLEQPQYQHHHGPRLMDGPTRLKTIGIAQKLGDLYHSIKKDEQAERYYLWSVEQLLKNHDDIEGRASGGSHSYEERLRNARDQETLRKQFDFNKLPTWMTKTDLGASLEALGGFYTSKGIYSNALPLYMRALSLIDTNSCHASVLMCNISDAFAGLGNMEDAMGWAERGLKVGTANNGQECDEGCGVLLYNLGMLHEMKGNMLKAQDYYKQSKQHGLRTGFTQCTVESNKALKRTMPS